MFHLIGFTITGGMFYYTAETAGKKGYQWALIGLTGYFFLGLAFRLFTEKYILSINSLQDQLDKSRPEEILSALAAIVLIGIAYFVQAKLLPRKKRIE